MKRNLKGILTGFPSITVFERAKDVQGLYGFSHFVTSTSLDRSSVSKCKVVIVVS